MRIPSANAEAEMESGCTADTELGGSAGFKRLAQLAEPSQYENDAASVATDPAMPDLVPLTPLSCSTPGSGCQCRYPVSLAAEADELISSGEGQQDVASCETATVSSLPIEVSEQAAEGAAALTEAREVLGMLRSFGPSSAEAKARRLHAIVLLRNAVRLGSHDTIEAAVGELLRTLGHMDPATTLPALAALGDCGAFPSTLAGDGARLLMQRRSWPEGGSTLRRLCAAVASADLSAALAACIDLVPRARAPQMLGFSWLLEPIAADLETRRGEEAAGRQGPRAEGHD